MPLGLRPRGILSLLGTLYPIEHLRSLSNPYLMVKERKMQSNCYVTFISPRFVDFSVLTSKTNRIHITQNGRIDNPFLNIVAYLRLISVISQLKWKTV